MMARPTGLFKLDFNSGERTVTEIDVVGHLRRETSNLCMQLFFSLCV